MSIHRQVRIAAFLCILGIVGIGSFASRLRGDTWPVVLTGQVTPGIPNGRFASVGWPSMNAAGDIVFGADVDVNGVKSGGIFELSHGTLSLVAAAGQALPDIPGQSFGAGLGDPRINDRGDIVFQAQIAPGPYQYGLFVNSGGSVRRIADTSTVAPGTDGVHFSSFSQVRINNNGDVAFASNGAGASGIFLSSGGVLRLVDTHPYDFFMNNRGDIVFSTPDGAITTISQGATTTVAVPGQAIPNSTLTLRAISPRINDDGDITFINSVLIFQPRGPSFSEGNAVVRLRGGTLEKLAGVGDAVPGAGGAVFTTPFNNVETNQSATVFTGRMILNGGAVSTINKLENGRLTTVAREDQFVEGIGTLDILGEAALDTQEGSLVSFVSNSGPGTAGIYTAEETRHTLLFPQIADGTASTDGWRTTFILANRSTSPASATVSFYRDDGNPMNINVGGETLSQRTISVPALGTAQFQTDGTGALQSGWATVDSDQVLSGIAVYALSDRTSKLLGEVGSSATVRLRSFSVFIEADARTATGIALANPNTQAADVTLILRDSNSTEVARSSVTLPSMGHFAKYAGEIFSSASLGKFQGKIEVVSSQPLVGLTLRQQESTFTSLPVIP